MLNEIGTVDNIPEFIEGVKNRYLLPVGNYPSVYLLDWLQWPALHAICTGNLLFLVLSDILYQLFSPERGRCLVLGTVYTKTMIPEQRSSGN